MLQKINMQMRTLPYFILILLVFWTSGPINAQEQSISALQQSAERGDANAQLQLANIYDNGQYVPQDFVSAAKWFRAAAEQGNATAQNQLGRYLRSGLGLEKNEAEAVEWLAHAAETGEPQYLFDLGQMYEHGTGTPQDYSIAVELYTRASDAGYAEATISLGVLYQNGTGVEQNFVKAHALYTGPANAGHARAQNNLGLLYVRGNGVPQDYELAVAWLQKAAQSGLATAMTNLGVMYENGFGVDQSDAQAASLYRQAGQNQDQSFKAFLQGVGFVSDPRLSLPDTKQITLQAQQGAANQGDPVAQFLLASFLVSATAPEYIQAAKLFQKAASAGLPAAKANLGLLYFQGFGVPQDFVTGYMWITLAAASGQPELAALRDAFTRKMTKGQLNEAQKMASDQWADQ